MKIELESKYNIGEKLFAVHNVRRRCPCCLHWVDHYIACELEIRGIDPSYRGVEYRVDLIINKNYRISKTSFSEYKIYNTRKKALDVADKLNKETTKYDSRPFAQYNLAEKILKGESQ